MYESLNAIWKEHKVLGRIDLETTKELMELLKGVFDSVPVESAKGYEAEVFEFAFKEGLMVYDAAYLFMAMRDGLTLVSDDERLLSKAIQRCSTARL
jgi:predicted nucleic acid-binding protein